MVIEMKNNTETLTCRDTNHFKEVNGIYVIEKKEASEVKLDEEN